MRIRAFLLCAVFILGLAAPIFAADLAGSYSAQGTNPDGTGKYKGSVIITRTQDTYQVVWSVGAVYVGTGLVVGDVFSVAYADENKSWFGVVAYRILDGGKKLEGIWSAHGGKVLGSETLEKQ